LETLYAIEEPVAFVAAAEEVTRTTPPSGFAVNVGSADCSRNKVAFVLTAQHLSHSSPEREVRFENAAMRVQLAFEMMMSKPPRVSIVSEIRRWHSASSPTSLRECVNR
jgi:hypothetical protein